MNRKVLRNMIDSFPRLAQILRTGRDLLDRRAPAMTTPWGFRLAGSELMASGTFEQVETRLIRDLLHDVDIFVNIGANVGYYCCHALSLGKPVVAIEPVARNLHYLLVNIINNGWADKTEVFPVALGSRVDVLPIWGGGTGASLIKGWASIPESYVTKVPVLTLDRVLGNSIRGKKSLILVDIEGAELKMLKGAAQTLVSQPRPIWIMEISITEHQPKGKLINPHLVETFEVFFELGYEAFAIGEENERIIKSDVLLLLSGEKQPMTHNFLFR